MDDASEKLSPEQRLNDLETLASRMADQILTLAARSLALQELLSERDVLPREAVLAWMDREQARAGEAIELSPEYEAFRRWRRQREAGGPAPDDQGPNA